MGQFLDMSEPITPSSLKTFLAFSSYNMGDYLTLSLTASGNPSTSSSPATSSPATGPLLPSPTPSSSCRPQSRAFDGQCKIRSDLEVTIKSINWEISELLEGNPYTERFNNGIFTHLF
jgi:hypothetical protein